MRNSEPRSVASAAIIADESRNSASFGELARILRSNSALRYRISRVSFNLLESDAARLAISFGGRYVA